MVPIDNGLKKNTLYKVLDLLPDDSELVPFEIHETASSAYGYATVESIMNEENGMEAIIDLLGPVVEDWPVDSAEYTTVLASGKKVYIGCDFRTVIIQSSPDK
ncbi:MAG TPA: hypothetical protein GXX46_10180 [Peptococcaceae bacterium]|nr:hypothetical protein [Peptococcaceae bacterium]